MPSQNILTRLTAIILDDELYGRENLRMIIENYCHEMPMRICSHQPKMIMWAFHLANKKQIINK